MGAVGKKIDYLGDLGEVQEEGRLEGAGEEAWLTQGSCGKKNDDLGDLGKVKEGGWLGGAWEET